MIQMVIGFLFYLNLPLLGLKYKKQNYLVTEWSLDN